MTHLDATSPPPEHPAPGSDQVTFQTIARTADFVKLRNTFRGFAFPMTIAGLTSYFVYVVLSIFLPDLMGTPLFGAFSVGMVIGLLQFAVTWIWTAIYVTFAAKRLDPLSSKLKADLDRSI